MILEAECLKRLLLKVDDGVVMHYLHFLLWLPLVVGGLVGHCALLIAVTEKFLIYMQPHYRILVTSFSINGILHLFSVAPLIFYNLIASSSHVFSTFHVCSRFLSNLFLFAQVMVLSVFGYQKIVSLLHYFSGRFLIYKKHAVDIIAIILFLALILVCLQLLDLHFTIVCDSNGIFFPISSFKYDFVHVRLIVYAILLFLCPLFFMITHSLTILVQRYKANVENLGLSNLSSTKVCIVTDQMRDKVNVTLYVMVTVFVLPEIFVIHFLDYFYSDKRSIFLVMICQYLTLAFNSFAFTPFFYYMRPLRTTVIARCSIFTKDSFHPRNELSESSNDTKNDTLLSIGSIELSKQELFRVESQPDDDTATSNDGKNVKFKIG